MDENTKNIQENPEHQEITEAPEPENYNFTPEDSLMISTVGDIKISFVCLKCRQVNEISTPKFETGCFSCSGCNQDNTVTR